MNLAFIGLGIMGLPMAGHLLTGGHRLTVHNRTKAKADPLIEQGATWADSPAAAVASAEVAFLCVSDTPDVEAVLFGPAGIIQAARPGLIVIDHSTISPAATRTFAARLADRGATLLDAPVSGGDVGARNAKLSIMVGGDQAAFNQVLPLLRLMGKTVTHTGRPGNGQLTKLVNQILVTVTNLAVSEALTFAQRSGLDPAATIQALAHGAAGSWQLTNLGPKMLNGDFAPGFSIDLQLKDLRLVLESAEELNLPLQAVELVQRHFTWAREHGWGKEGTQSLFKTVGEVS